MSARVLITGAAGFAGSHLADLCGAEGDEVTGCSRRGGRGTLARDLRDPQAAAALVHESGPKVVYHLAALASVGRSWEDPAATLADNDRITLNLFEALREHAPGARVLFASSGEIYGPPARLPVDESAPLRPQSPYAVAKATGDMLAALYADAHGLATVRARAFNHAGPRQTPTFAIASFARQLAAAQLAGEGRARIVTGNPDTRRDYTDVRDVVRAYRLLAARGEPGEVYNVGAGRSASARELVAALGEIAGIDVEHVVDDSLVRGHEVAEVVCSHERLTATTGWEPQIPLEQTLADTLEWWREELGREGAAAGDA